MRYKGFTIYSVVLFPGKARWRVQQGISVLGDYKTIGGAKSAITWAIKAGKAGYHAH